MPSAAQLLAAKVFGSLKGTSELAAQLMPVGELGVQLCQLPQGPRLQHER